VGNAWELHTAGLGAAGAACFDSAAYLAVRAYVRHNCTDYDERLFKATGGLDGKAGDEARYQVRDEVRDAIEAVLRKWR